jgi:hypothetical protein
MSVSGTGSGKLVLESLKIQNGKSGFAGGVNLYRGAIVDISLCIFQSCEATGWGGSGDGGAIYVEHGGTLVNVYGTQFFNNKVRM